MDEPIPDKEVHPEATRPLTGADLGPQSSESCSSSLVPYVSEEESDPEEVQEQQEGTLEHMETDEQEVPEAPIKEGMGINTAPGNYLLAPLRYIRAGEDSKNEEGDPDEEEDLEAPYLASRPAPS